MPQEQYSSPQPESLTTDTDCYVWASYLLLSSFSPPPGKCKCRVEKMSLAFKFLNGCSCCLILPSWSGEDCNNWKKGIDLNAWGLEGRPKFGISYQLNIQEFLPILGNAGVFHINMKLASLITGTCHGFHPCSCPSIPRLRCPASSFSLKESWNHNNCLFTSHRWLESEAFSGNNGKQGKTQWLNSFSFTMAHHRSRWDSAGGWTSS